MWKKYLLKKKLITKILTPTAGMINYEKRKIPKSLKLVHKHYYTLLPVIYLFVWMSWWLALTWTLPSLFFFCLMNQREREISWWVCVCVCCCRCFVNCFLLPPLDAQLLREAPQGKSSLSPCRPGSSGFPAHRTWTHFQNRMTACFLISRWVNRVCLLQLRFGVGTLRITSGREASGGKVRASPLMVCVCSW